MNTFEKLLDKDPIGAFDKIKQNYVRYFKTMYKFENNELDAKKNTELEDESKENIYKQPYLEVLPEYTTATLKGVEVKTIEELIPLFSKGFKNLIDGDDFIKKFIKPGLMNYPPYGHQVEMYTKAFLDGNNTVITSGTGSGKTESFLLPLFGQLYKEGKNWESPNYNQNNWYEGENGARKKYNNTYQRLGENRTAAVRAMIMYPMNALVEDQMTRLRKALDCDEVREHFDSVEGLKGNRIYFGRYNGQTIGKKKFDRKNNSDHKKCQDELNKLITLSNTISTYTEDTTNDQDVKYISPRLSVNSRTSEMITRWDMQEFPPDILISNFSMLSIMLMREAEASIFEKTKDWLKDENNVFHLIIDELHLFRGTAGTELAYLMRMFFDAIGIEPVIDDGNGGKKPNKQLRILASSASLGTEDQTQKFLEEFFGVYNSDGTKAFSIQNGTDYHPVSTKVIDYTKFEIISTDYPFLDNNDKNIKKNELANDLRYESLKTFFDENAETIFAKFKSETKIEDENGVRQVPKPLQNIKNTIFEGNENALRGFLIIRADSELKNLKLPRIRFHQFFKYIEGLWTELLPQVQGQPQQPFGQLMYQAQEVFDNGSEMHKVLELLRCEGCGAAFIGGNANRVANRVTLSLNSPELEKIPNRNPTPMVQNKWFHEYAVFWPTEKEPSNQNSNFFLLDSDGDREDFNCTNRQGLSAYNQVNLRANWQKATINPYNGEIKRSWTGDAGSIKGYVFNVINNNNNNENPELIALNYALDNPIQALPHKCPSCSRDYTKRKYTKSPIRNFRTGIARSNQLLSKELIYQLSGEKPKLVGFSDSRQDAADQAFGIEQEHYRDMLRLLFLECIKELTKPDKQILNLIEKTIEIGSAVFTIIDAEFGDINNRHQIAAETIVDNITARANYLNPQVHFNLRDLVDVNGGELNGLLVKKLLKLGINPAGVEFDKQFVNGYHWSTLYEIDVQTNNIRLRSLNEIENEIGHLHDFDRIKTEVKQNLFSSIYQNSFGKFMALDTESAGIGYISFKLNEADVLALSNLLPPAINAIEFMNAFLRVLGDHYRYTDPDSGFTADPKPTFNDLSASIKKPIITFCNQNSIDLNSLVDQLNIILETKCSQTNIVLNPNHLQYNSVLPQNPYYKCTNCSKIHLYKGMGICTNTQCLTPLDDIPNGVVQDLNLNNYIGYDLLVEKRNPIRLHTEELTGQTDNQAERQLEFKGIILDNQNSFKAKLTKEIDMINVTTTMEVGIDIGSLEGIFQGNMPPTRYNYQQRVGRGGRRGQAYSCAVTFCRGKSHDNYYYHSATDEMVGSVPVAPSLSIAPHQLPQGGVSIKTSITRRILTKNILKFAFIELMPIAKDQYGQNDINESIPIFSDTHGEFGHIFLWDTVQPLLREWINNNHSLIQDYVHKYLNQFNSGDQIQHNIDDLFSWFTETMVDDLNTAYNQKTTNNGLAEVFAEAGYLPMFGMPSSTRVMYHGIDSNNNDIRTIDRPVEQSITEFAPGAIKTKDKGFYESVGLTIPMNYRNGNNAGIYSMEKFDPNYNNFEKFNALEYSFNLNILEDGSISTISAYDPNFQIDGNITPKRLVVPKAFRTLRIRGNRGAASDNSDTRSNFSSASIFAIEDGTTVAETIENCNVTLFGVFENTKGEIWHINDNNRNYFRGKEISGNFQTPTGWITEPSIINGQDRNFFPNFIVDNHINIPNYESFHGEIALGVKKTTEMIKIEINQIPNEICLNVNDPENNNSTAIKAAFYSAAFILQRSLAHNLDIQPNEIEISELKINQETGVPYLYLSDALPNGAGFVSFLLEKSNGQITNLEILIKEIVNGEHPFVKSIISNEHIKQCKTSCQKCLNTYDNSGYHHILDWRLGIGLLRLMIDRDFKFGFDANLNYPELKDLSDLINDTTTTYGKILDIKVLIGAYNLKYVSKNDFGTITNSFVKHPLWNKNNIQNNTNLFVPGIQINNWLNFFELLRKPANSN
ncbi:DEAD/DEAH box helicase [Flavobacterium chungnamense]|uniref:DEAD/DEAH box helicase n=1 Tax=Flavobacterium chungnamense TaxID=706182 RepID=A0ABP7UUR6_9FLAO